MLLSPLYRQGNQGTERQSNLPVYMMKLEFGQAICKYLSVFRGDLTNSWFL